MLSAPGCVSFWSSVPHSPPITPRPARSTENQFDVSITLFTTMAAINAAGYDVDLNSAANYPIRNQIRAELAKRNVPAMGELKHFYQEHRKGTDTATLSQYISFALLAGGPPRL